MKKDIFITWSNLYSLIRYGKTNPTEEVIAILTGHVGDSKYIVQNVFHVHNVAINKRTFYEPDHNQFYNILSGTTLLDKKSNNYLLGIFHTHVNSASVPSVIDIAHANYEGFYLIYSVSQDTVGTYYAYSSKNPNVHGARTENDEYGFDEASLVVYR